MPTFTFLTVTSVLLFLAVGIYLVAAYKDTTPVVSGSILITAGIIGIPIALLFVGLHLLPYLSSRTSNNTRSTKKWRIINGNGKTVNKINWPVL